MPEIIVKKARTGSKKLSETTQETEISQNNILKKTIEMASTMKMYPRPVRK